MATKAKTNRGAAKRFRVNGAGTVIKRRRTNRNHILSKHGQNRKRRLRCRGLAVSASNVLKVFKLLRAKLISSKSKQEG